MRKKADRATHNYFIYDPECGYPSEPPYDPEMQYPEYPFKTPSDMNGEKNDVYRMIRELFLNSNMDKEHAGSAQWSPLGKYIKPGNTVLIKPNLVMHTNPAEKDSSKELECLITHPSVVRCLFDYVYIALQGQGKIIIADAPVQNCLFDVLLQKSGYGELFRNLAGKSSDKLVVDIADLRDIVLTGKGGIQRQSERRQKRYNGKVVDLKSSSKFADIEGKKNLRVTNYASTDTVSHHIKGKNEYCISEALLEADVVISIPKPKTHRIAGYTAALKNMIGINARKEYLPHHRKGPKGKAGDEYVGTHKVLKWLNSTGNDVKNLALKYQNDFFVDLFNGICRRIGRKLDVLEKDRKAFGMWHGNDTMWRTILDVNKIVYLCDKKGKICAGKQRRVLHFGDMVVCGDKEGPLNPSYKYVGGILFSDNPVSFDYCVTRLMGFNYKKFPTLTNALRDRELIEENPGVIRLRSNEAEFDKKVMDISKNFGFVPSSGWED